MTSAPTVPLRSPSRAIHSRLPETRPGDVEDAVRRLHDEHAKALLAYATWYTANRTAAEDAVQETFVRAWRHLPRLLADGRPLRPWLRQVLRRVLIDAGRAARAHPATSIDALADRGVDGGYDGLLDRVHLDGALQRLSPAHREVLVEVYLHDAPTDHVAARLGIPHATVRTRLHYARIRLRHLLSESAAS
jgi:RNA polymerase sigma-70 factor (ECF subfamily)